MNVTHDGLAYLRKRRREALRSPGMVGYLARVATQPAGMGLFYANLLLDPRVCRWMDVAQHVDARTAYAGNPRCAQLTDLIAAFYDYYHDISAGAARYADDDTLAVGLAVLARASSVVREAALLVPGAAGNFSRSAVGQSSIRTYMLSPLEVDVLRRRGRTIYVDARREQQSMAAHLAQLAQRYTRIFLPLHDAAGVHWTLMVAERAADCWEAWFVDSLGGAPEQRDLDTLHVLLGETPVLHIPPVPEQQNDVACGLHVLSAAWAIETAPSIAKTRWTRLTTARAERVHATLLSVLLNCLSLLASDDHMQALGVRTPNVPHCPRVAPDFEGTLRDVIVYPESTRVFLKNQSQRYKRYMRQHVRASPTHPRPAPGVVMDLT